MKITLTELRQNLFRLADQVVDGGEALVIERRGVRLKLVRDDALSGGRLQRLQAQDLVAGSPLLPSESPAEWIDTLPKVAEPPADYRG